MAERKPFALRLPEPVYLAIRRWADDELRSINGQIEYLLIDALRRAGRLRERGQAGGAGGEDQLSEER